MAGWSHLVTALEVWLVGLRLVSPSHRYIPRQRLSSLGDIMSSRELCVGITWAVAFVSASVAFAADATQTIGHDEPGVLHSLSIETGDSGHGDDSVILIGNERRQQLVVTGNYSSGELRDLTRRVAYHAEPSGVVSIDDSGLMSSRGNGTAAIVVEFTQDAPDADATADPISATIQVTVKSFERNPPVNFPNQVVPIFTKLQCNGGGCHGKSGGQNGFQLSLLGFEPREDYEHLVRESRGRRVNRSAPQQSLLLQKVAGLVPHGGGAKAEVDSHHYKLIQRWIAEGASFGDLDVARVVGIEVFPKARMMGPESEQQLDVVARYSDGTTEDVTSIAQYEPNLPEMAEVTLDGLVTTGTLTGDVAVMIRYQSHVAVFRSTIPLGAPIESLPPQRNFIDQWVFEKWQLLGLPPSEICDDATFIRRVTVDIAGRLPQVDETAAFLADEDPRKRDRWIDDLLASTDYADNFARKWSAILRNKRTSAAGDDGRHGTYALHGWIRQTMHENRPYDEFVRDIVAASGDATRNPGVIWYRNVKESNTQAEDAAQLFLGMRMQCAQCHHHPFEKWSQGDYYSLTSFFSRVGRKPGWLPTEELIYHRRGEATAINPRTGKVVTPAGLGGEPLQIAPEEDPRQRLVDWMAEPENPFFARTLVNRYWKHFFSRGLVEPEDDMRVTNPATNPELLDELAEHFIAGKFDMKDLIRTICQSTTYQLSSLPNTYNADDQQNFSRYYPKRLSAEVLLDSVDVVTASSTRFPGVPPGTRAMQLPDTEFSSYFLNVFGRPEGNSACECEQSDEANLSQGLHLINSADLFAKLSANSGGTASLAIDGQPTLAAKIRNIYLTALSRQPTEDELATVTAFIEQESLEQDSSVALACEDVLWALINTKEFLFNH